MTYIFIFFLIAFISNLIATYYLFEIRKILKFEGYELGSIFFREDYKNIKKLVENEKNIDKKNEYLKVIKIYNITYRIVQFMI